MQFHLNGFRPGNPLIAPASPLAPAHTEAVPSQVDVLIVGCGPAGLTLAAQLAAFPDIRTGIVEQKEGPMELGQADGIACRTMEMFEAFEFADSILKEACWINDVTFWKPDPAEPGRIARHGRVQDTEDGLSEFPHVILNQARVHDHYLERMRNSPSRLEPHYARRVLDVKIDHGAADYPVTVTLERCDAAHAGQIETVQARYVVGCDGARSNVRRAIGRQLVGDSANQAWGVMDVLAVTDFPDVRYKVAIQSEQGNVLIIPREGGHLVRFYVEMDKLDADERVASRNITVEQLIATAQRVLHPYKLDVKNVPWWSVYEIGQRILNGDGGSWIYEPYDPEAIFQLDRYHVYQEITGKIRDKKAQREIRELFDTGKPEEMLEYIQIYATSAESPDEKDKSSQKAWELYQYLEHNREGLLLYDKRGIKIAAPPEGILYKRMGVQENQNCTVITLRMKNRRMRWSVNGANNLAKILYQKENKELIETIERYTDGLVFTMQMQEIVETLSAAKAPKKDGKGNPYEIGRAHV